MESFSLTWLAPLSYALVGLYALGRADRERVWQVAVVGAWSALVVGVLVAGQAVWSFAVAEPPADILGVVMLLLISLLAWVVVVYSRRYLAGESGQQRYVAALALTLAAVATVILTDHLGVLLLAWMASSLGLHPLLTFYPDRPAARLVAYKRFLLSRLSELSLFAALVVIYHSTGTLSLVAIAGYVETAPSLPVGLHLAAVLIALAVIFKTAQLPVHGWLIQVMEAPTPVSALLHAGIINLGGFVLIRFAYLLAAAPAAQTLLLVVGSLTAAFAGLVMMTRISIKVRLAWSTCAQMGFMLMQCGLGLYELALLHLVTHSVYKAYAFLSAGDRVRESRLRQLFAADGEAGTLRGLTLRLGAAPLSISLVALSVLVWQTLAPAMALPWVVVLIVGLGLAPLLWRKRLVSAAGLGRGLFELLLLAQLYIVLHWLFATLLALPPLALETLAAIGVGAVFALLYVAQTWIQVRPQNPWLQRLYPWAFAGFYLDEHLTRLTLRIWPLRIPPGQPQRRWIGGQPTLQGEPT